MDGWISGWMDGWVIHCKREREMRRAVRRLLQCIGDSDEALVRVVL